MPALRARSMALTGCLSSLLDDLPIEVITPRDPAARGCQLSVRFAAAESVVVTLAARGVVADFRAPDIIRVAPVPFYNTYHDAWRLARRPGPSGPGYDSQSYAQGIGIGIDVSRRSATLGSRRLERELAIHAGRSAREAHDIGLWGISKRSTRP